MDINNTSTDIPAELRERFEFHGTDSEYYTEEEWRLIYPLSKGSSRPCQNPNCAKYNLAHAGCCTDLNLIATGLWG